jgi:hypothetical protein
MGTKTMTITIQGEGYGSSVREWQVEEELVRVYCIAYDGWVAKGGVELSKALYEAMSEAGQEGIEAFGAPVMLRAIG